MHTYGASELTYRKFKSLPIPRQGKARQGKEGKARQGTSWMFCALSMRW